MLIDTLIKWNRWGKNRLPSGKSRHMMSQIECFLDTEEIVGLIGLRRSGKSTLLYQMMDRLEARGVDPKAMLHINFEEPAFATQLTFPLLDQLYETYRNHVYPEGKAYLFFDEIQTVQEWERWARARNETENIKLFVTGSSSQMMSRELGTLLTGRHVSFHVFPLNFAELLDFRSVEIPNTPWPFKPPAIIQHAIHFLLRWGSLPKIVLATHDEQREKLLSQYFDDILLRDIAMRHSIRDLATLRALAVQLFTQTASLVSYSRLAKVFNVSTVLAQNYCHYLQEAYLLELLPIFSLKAGERQRYPQKCHAIDLGLRNRMSLSHSIDRGHLIESCVFQIVQQQTHDGVFYWKKQGEIDLLVRNGNTITTLIQVVAEGLADPSVLNREINALKEGLKHFPQANALLITADSEIPDALPVHSKIRVVPLWQFLLAPERFF